MVVDDDDFALCDELSVDQYVDGITGELVELDYGSWRVVEDVAHEGLCASQLHGNREPNVHEHLEAAGFSLFGLIRDLGELDGAEIRLSEPVSVGAEATPTPAGEFYVDAVATLGPGDPAGAARLVLGRFSSLIGGSGTAWPAVLEGAARAEQLGRPATDGRILLSDDAVSALLARAPPGTPVQIVS